MASSTLFTKVAGGIGGTSLICAALSGHGTSGLLIAGLGLAAAALMRSLQLFWLVTEILAIREHRWMLRQVDQDDTKLRRHLLASNPVVEIARARGRDGATPASPPSDEHS
jgi:hypothetical protein